MTERLCKKCGHNDYYLIYLAPNAVATRVYDGVVCAFKNVGDEEIIHARCKRCGFGFDSQPLDQERKATQVTPCKIETRNKP